jgi:dTDP-4-amino-4,6-dideoxygalactose transaminase
MTTIGFRPGSLEGTVRFLDLAADHDEVRAGLDAVWADALASSGFVGGAPVAAFENAWAEACGVAHCISVANGTDALHLILRALGIGRGDEVVVPANTFVATAEAVVSAGATPRFADVDPDTLLLGPSQLAAAITPRTAAVMLVHLYGQPAVTEEVMAVARAAGIAVIEDAAQAHGARWRGRPVGGFGAAAAFSFYPGKNLGALGDGGAVVTDDPVLARRVRVLANHGRRPGDPHVHEVSGWNSRLDTLQAAVLSVKLGRLTAWNAARRHAAATYAGLLRRVDGVRPVVLRPDALSAHHLQVVRVAERDRVRAALDAAGIETGLHYPVPCHRQVAFAAWADEPLPVAEAAAGEILSLPMHPHLDDATIERVCEALHAAVG